MKRLLCLATIACITIFASCEKENFDSPTDITDNTEAKDLSGNLYGIWALTTKSETYTNSAGKQVTNNDDYTSSHFSLAISEFPCPHAIVKKGSLSAFDLDDVDVDSTLITYDKDKHQVSFSKTLWLSDNMLTRNMYLKGTFQITELSDTKLVIQQKEVLGSKIIAYSYTRQK